MDFWSSQADLKLMPGTGVVREIHKKGYELQGVEDSVETRYPGLRMRLGQRVRLFSELNKSTGIFEYGLLVSPNWPTANLGLLQIDMQLGMLLPYSYLMMWWVDHPKATILLHSALRRYMNEYLVPKLPERIHYA